MLAGDRRQVRIRISYNPCPVITGLYAILVYILHIIAATLSSSRNEDEDCLRSQRIVTFTPWRSNSEITSALAGVRKRDTLFRFVSDKSGDMSIMGTSTKEIAVNDARLANSGAYATGKLRRLNSAKLVFPERKASELVCTSANANVVSR